MNRQYEASFLDSVGQILRVYSEKIKEKGEDAYLSIVCEEGAMIGCFDGCGGIGARRYEVFDSHTGAYVASRVTAEAVADWFLRTCEYGVQASLSEEVLAGKLREVLDSCKRAEPRTSGLKGSLTRDFPTTLAIAAARSEILSFFWAGDSRAYILDETGLHQMTRDDVAQQDAMANLSDDGPLKNVVCASGSFKIHKTECVLKRPGILLTCTDGCFGYLQSPMAFEQLLLQTLDEAETPAQWEQLLGEQIGSVAGDDYTLMALVLGFDDFFVMKRALSRRIGFMRKEFESLMNQMQQNHRMQDQKIQNQAALLAWWQEYRNDYERY